MKENEEDFCSHLEESERRTGRETRPTGGDKRRAATSALEWKYDIPLLNNLFLGADLLRVFGISLLITQVLITVVGIAVTGQPIFLPLQIWAIVLGIIAALLVLTMLVIYQNRYGARFAIDAQCACFETGGREGKIIRVLAVLGLLAGGWRAAGPALLATSHEKVSIEWQDVYCVSIHRASRVITLHNSWRSVIRLYCPPEIFDAVVTRVQSYAAEGARRRARRHIRRPPPYDRYLTRAGLTAIAFLASLAWLANRDSSQVELWRFYWEVEEIAPFALVVSIVVALAGLLEGLPRRVVALLATLGSLGFLYWLAALALAAYTEYDGTRVFHGYQVEPLLLAVSLAGGAALAALSAIRLFGRRDAPTQENDDARA